MCRAHPITIDKHAAWGKSKMIQLVKFKIQNKILGCLNIVCFRLACGANSGNLAKHERNKLNSDFHYSKNDGNIVKELIPNIDYFLLL